MSRVTIFNRIDGDASHSSLVSGRLSNSVVLLLDDKNTTLKKYKIGNATNITRFDFGYDTNPCPSGPEVVVHGESKDEVLVAAISSAACISFMALLVALYFLRKKASNDQGPITSNPEGDLPMSEEGPERGLQMSEESIPRAVAMTIEPEVPPRSSSVWAMKMLPRTAATAPQYPGSAIE